MSNRKDVSSLCEGGAKCYYGNVSSFNEEYTLPYKSLVFKNCHFNPSFSTAMFGLQPLKLKELVFTGSTMDLSPLLKEPAFDVESLEIDVGTGSFAREFIDADYAVHFQKTSLKKVRLVDFWFIDRAIICEAAEQSGFLLDEKLAELAPIYEFTRKQ